MCVCVYQWSKQGVVSKQNSRIWGKVSVWKQRNTIHNTIQYNTQYVVCRTCACPGTALGPLERVFRRACPCPENI
jgi:hypothetical protein